MGCGCPLSDPLRDFEREAGMRLQHEALRAEAEASPPQARGRLQLDRAALRQALGGRDLVMEANAAAPKASGRPGANAAIMWSYFTTSVYKSGDLPVLATRESLQNSVDAIRAAVKARKTKAGTGRFAVSLDFATRSLTWEDNGIGMDAETILTKFLSLGESGKRDAGDSDEAAGGFGVAKAVILGASRSFRWELHSRDNLAVCRGANQDVEVYEAPFLQGTRITISDVDPKFLTRWDYTRRDNVDLLQRLREMLSFNDLPDVTLVLNDQVVEPAFSRKAGSRVNVQASWGRGTEARIKAYRRTPGDMTGAYYVRLNGLFQFSESSRRGNLKADVVVDLSTRIRPGQSEEYPLNAGRDSLQGAASYAFRDLVDEVERENESMARDHEDEVLDPEGDGEAFELQGELAQAAIGDADFRAALKSALGGIMDFFAEQVKDPGVGDESAESAAPSGTRAPEEGEGPTRTMVLPPGLDLGMVGILTTAEAPNGEAAPRREGPNDPRPDPAAVVERRIDAAHRLYELLSLSDQLVVEQRLGTDLVALNAWVEEAIRRAFEGEPPSDYDTTVVQAALDKAVEATAKVPRGGKGAAKTVQQAADSILAGLLGEDPPPTTSQPRKPQNPFGQLAGLRISRQHYDRDRARRFKRGWKRWLPHLTAWDLTLRLVAGEAQIRKRFKPGFVLDDKLIGLATGGGGKANLIYIHPDKLEQVIKAHAERPLAIAAFLHGVACHELTHLDGRMGQGHDESYVAARENLGHATAHLLPAIALFVQRVLRLKVPPTEDQLEVQKLRQQLARAEAKAGRGDTARAEVKRLQKALEKAETALGEAEGRSEVVRDRCGRSCADCVLGAKGEKHGTDGTRIRFTSIPEWIEGWMALQRRRHSASRYKAEAAHLDALPDSLVAAAGWDDIKALDRVLDKIKVPRGRREGHPKTRIIDAMDRRMAILSQMDRQRTRDPGELVDMAIRVLRLGPPPGVELSDVDGFVSRHRDTLVDIVRGRLQAARGTP